MDEPMLERLFLGARSQNGWRAEPVSDAALRDAYDIAKWGPNFDEHAADAASLSAFS